MSKRPIKIWIITLFPEYFGPFFSMGVASSAFEESKKGDRKFDINLVMLRDYSNNNYGSVDDYPFGGGPGMIIRADVLKNALIKGVVDSGGYGEAFREKLHIVFTGPAGVIWNNDLCIDFSKEYFDNENEGRKDLVFICGRYEGVDQRFLELYVDQQISIGDYVLTGGELAVQVILDSAIRFTPKGLGNSESAGQDSFINGLLEHPQYTRPRVFDENQVPEILLSGNHGKISEFRKNERIRMTKENRPDLYRSFLNKRNQK